jgi:MinD superfamily P-loop ATPase
MTDQDLLVLWDQTMDPEDDEMREHVLIVRYARKLIEKYEKRVHGLELDVKENDALIYDLREDLEIAQTGMNEARASVQAQRAYTIRSCASVCDAVANGFVSDVNPEYSPEAASGARACASALYAMGPDVPVAQKIVEAAEEYAYTDTSFLFFEQDLSNFVLNFLKG